MIGEIGSHPSSRNLLRAFGGLFAPGAMARDKCLIRIRKNNEIIIENGLIATKNGGKLAALEIGI